MAINKKLDMTAYTENILKTTEKGLAKKLIEIFNHMEEEDCYELECSSGLSEKEIISLLKKSNLTPALAYAFMCLIAIQPETFFNGYPLALEEFNKVYLPLKKKSEIPKLSKSEILNKYFN